VRAREAKDMAASGKSGKGQAVPGRRDAIKSPTDLSIDFNKPSIKATSLATED